MADGGASGADAPPTNEKAWPYGHAFLCILETMLSFLTWIRKMS